MVVIKVSLFASPHFPLGEFSSVNSICFDGDDVLLVMQDETVVSFAYVDSCTLCFSNEEC